MAMGEALSPITRVVELLKALSGKLEEELKTETDLFIKYQCWAKTVIDTKTASNKAAESRIDYLDTYIADIEAGRVEFTSERSDLEKELAGLNSDIETATAIRDKEHADYLAAKDEMTKGIAALKDAIAVLKAANEEKGEDSLLRMEARLGQGSRSGVTQAQSLERAALIGRQYLSKGDAHFLQRLLTGDEPISKDWKKLNRKATFKMKYKQRSGEIQGVLEKLQADFEAGLKEADSKEEQAAKEFETLMASKKGQKETAEEGLTNMEKETGAAGLAKSDAEAEKTDLKTQVENDEKFIKETKDDLDTKSTEWDERKTLRTGEIEAVSKAIAILSDDEARDLFKRSLASQSKSELQVSFLQRSVHRHVQVASEFRRQCNSAVAVLRGAARQAGDDRVALIATRVGMVSQGKMETVIKAIDELIETLKKEGTEDETTKEQCESDREADTKQAADLSNEIDELTEKAEKLQTEIEEIEAEIEEKQEEIKTIEKQMKEAKELREEQHAEWVKSDKDDEEAEAVVRDAIAVLDSFYKENGLALLLQRHRQAPEVVAGEAPPPPPATWEEPYKGAEESKGILAILDVIAQDIAKDRADAKKQEDDAEKEYQSFVKESDSQISTLNDSISTLTGQKGDKEEEMKTAKETKVTKKGELEAVMKKLKDAQPGCDFFLVNFDIRKSNREIEIGSLEKAKSILEKYESSASE